MDGIRPIRCREKVRRSTICRCTSDFGPIACCVGAAHSPSKTGANALMWPPGRAKCGRGRPYDSRFRGNFYFDQVPIKAEPFITDHLLSPAETSSKQLAGEFFQVVQKPSLLSFQVPSP